MLQLATLLRQFRQDEDGAALVEYAIMFAVLAAATVGALTAVGDGLAGVFTSVTGLLTNITGGLTAP